MEQGTRNTCFLSGVLWEQGTGNREQVSRAKRDAPQGRRRLNCRKIFFGGGEPLREQGTGNSEQGTCRVPQVFPEHVPEPLRENPSLVRNGPYLHVDTDPPIYGPGGSITVDIDGRQGFTYWRMRSISTVDRDLPTENYGGWWIKIRDNFVICDYTCADFAKLTKKGLGTGEG